MLKSTQWLKIQSSVHIAITCILLLTCQPVMTSSEDFYWITNVTIVDPIEGVQPSKNVLIKQGRITEITNYEEMDKVFSIHSIDGQGLYLIAFLHFLSPYHN